MKLNPIVALLALAGLSVAAIAEQKPFHLQDGDRVVFYGDSITDQRLYTTFAETYVVTRFPKLQVSFTHSGWGGDRVSGGGGGPVALRLKRDVFAYNPTVMTIMLGMNDGSYRAFDEGIFNTFSEGIQKIIDAVQEADPGIKLTLIQPSPFDDVTQPPRFDGGYNNVLVRYGQFIKDLGDREQFVVADLNGPIVAALEKAFETDPDLAKKIIPDRVHPGAGGHLLMAGELLKAWNAPSLVASVEIDADERAVTRCEGAKVTDLNGENGLSWTQVDAALPMPVDMNDPVIALAVRSSDFMTALNQQPMKITGLKDAAYTLSIDGERLGEFTAEELAKGVNLAALPTPMMKQARDVHQLTLRHNNVHFTRWRQIEVPMAGYQTDRIQEATRSLIDALDEEEAELVKEQRAAARPVEHRFKLTPQ